MKTKRLLFSVALFAVGLHFSALAATPETAPYRVSDKEGDYELREYPVLTVATTVTKEERDGAFMRLFRYIQGDNAKGQKIEMTTPVFMDRGEAGTAMSFVMPEVARKDTPAPTGDAVKLSQRAAAKVAVLRFAGMQSKANEDAALEKLRVWMKARGLAEKGSPSFAYYDPPWILGPWRRNEVLVPVGK